MNWLDLIQQLAIGFTCIGWLGKKLVEYVQSRKSKEKAQRNYAQSSMNDSIVRQKIYRILWEELARYTPDGHITVIQYHNGGKFYTGRDIQRMTLTYEVKHPDLSSIKAEYQGIVIGEEFGTHQQILHGEVYCPDHTDIENESVKSTMLHHKITSFYAVMAKNEYGLPLASVVYSFKNEINPLTASERQAIKRRCNTIFNLLADIQDRNINRND